MSGDNDLFISPFLNIDPSLLVNVHPYSLTSQTFLNRIHLISSYSPTVRNIEVVSKGHSRKSVLWLLAVVPFIVDLYLVGAAFGCSRAFYNAINDPDIKKLPSRALQRTQILNHVTKSGGSWAQTAGSIGLIYALADFSIHKLRGGADDEINTVASATTTGLLYRSPGLFSPGGWRSCARGGLVGLTVGLAIAGFTSWDRIKELLGSS